VTTIWQARRGGGIWRAAACAALILLGVAGPAGPGRAEAGAPRSLNLWPFFDDRVDPLEQARVRSGVGPLIHHGRSLDGDVEERGLRPLFFWRREKGAQTSEWEFLYPLATYRRREGDWDFQFLRLLNARGEGSPQAGREEHADFSPFYFSGVRESGETYHGILPFWGKVYDRLFWEEWEWVLFPLYSRTVRSGAETFYFPWPILSVTRGVDPASPHRGFRLVPLYGHETKEGAFEKYFALWPLFMYQRTGLDGDEPEEMLAFFPFYAARRSPKWDQTTVLWPLFTYTDDRGKAYEQWDVAWPIFKYARGESRQALFIFPLYMEDRKLLRDEYLFREIRYHDFAVLFPLFIRQREEFIGSRKERYRILWYLYSDAREEGRDGATRRIDVWPLMRYDRDREGGVVFQTLALLEPLLPRNEWIERNYSPLWALYTYRANPAGESVHSFLWNLVRHEETLAGRSIEFLGPLLAYRETGTGEEFQFSLLGGLLRYEVKRGERTLSLGGAEVASWSATLPPVATLEVAGGNR
jgi:hypothetical protein